MAKKGYTPEQIINKLREAEILLNQGATIAVISKKIGVSDHTYYRWRKEYGGMRVDQQCWQNVGKRLWGRYSQRSDSNRRPAVYETAALPLRYAGTGLQYHKGIKSPLTA